MQLTNDMCNQTCPLMQSLHRSLCSGDRFYSHIPKCATRTLLWSQKIENNIKLKKEHRCTNTVNCIRTARVKSRFSLFESKSFHSRSCYHFGTWCDGGCAYAWLVVGSLSFLKHVSNSSQTIQRQFATAWTLVKWNHVNLIARHHHHHYHHHHHRRPTSTQTSPTPCQHRTRFSHL